MPYLDVNHTTLYYEDEGAGQSLLFVHGWAASGRVWGAQQSAFVPDFRVVTLDWRGCGRSGRPAAGNNVDGIVADLVELIDVLNLDRPIVIGSSIGATFATELGLRHPELITGVVPVDGPSYWPSQGMSLDGLREGFREDRAGTFANWVPDWYVPGDSPALIDWTVRQMLDSGVFIDEHFVPLTTYDPRPALPGLKVPIHYIHGEIDPQIPLEVARTCAALTPGATVTAVAGAGHMPQLEQPSRFNAALLSVLDTFAGANNA